ncbi:AbgT family transporter [Sporosarcina sp. P2]|uniref:AbgT family transporter n=1 Tax=Sporosarcina sp. P2 TaxID=2048251 RepID=UPI0018ED3574|nr:AbgT family transporter [Sporosarcina sp. P2]
MEKQFKADENLIINKKKFQLPHLFWIMMGILLLGSIATYIIPAGNFATDEDGTVLGNQFAFLGHQTPVSPWKMMMLILDGLNESSIIIYLVLVSGATIAVLLASGAIDNILNWAIFKLQDKGMGILVSVMFILMVYIGALAGSDSLIALVPIGVIFARKLKLDPLVAIGITTFPTLIGFATGPQGHVISQLMIGVTPYSGIGFRFISVNLFMIVGLIYLMRYIKKIQSNEKTSLMYSNGWRAHQLGNQYGDDVIKEEKLKLTSILALLVFIAHFLVIIAYSVFGGEQLYHFFTVVAIIAAIVIGLLTRMSFDDIGENFSKGIASIAFIAFIIGLARVMSLVLTEGNIIDTIVFTMTKPLMELNQSFATIGISIVVAIINPLIPSATSKAAILVPIIEPIANTLGLPNQLAIQAFQFGDGFTNLVSPVLGWTIGSCVMAGVPFTKWVRWVFPAVLIFMLMSFVILYILTIVGWTGGE